MVGAVQMAGSVVVEDEVTLFGQVGVVGHTRIGRGATVLAQAGVNRDLPPGGTYVGAPARPARELFRLEGHLKNLDAALAKIKQLEAEVRALREAAGLEAAPEPGEAKAR
jgi:UDP-3-O-[3-hydroxymyristoyl] glucosamine N-acyltransferase